VNFNISGVFVQDDGYVDTSKVEVSLIDADEDGIPDDPAGFTKIVAPEDRIVFELYNNEVTGYQSSRPWIANWGTELATETGTLYLYFPVSQTDPSTLFGAPFIANALFDPNNPTEMDYILYPSTYSAPGYAFVYLDEAELVFVDNTLQMLYNGVTISVPSIANQVTAFYNNMNTFVWMTGPNSPALIPQAVKNNILANYILNKSFLITSISPPGFGVYYALATDTTANLGTYPTGQIITASVDKYHFDKNGKVFTQNTSVPPIDRFPFYFKWSHYSPIDQRVDPAPTNIIDMIVITDSYYRDMVIWKNNNGTIATIPAPPTTEELRIQFQDLNQYKMVSDAMVWNSGEFKILFGTQAESELQATFKVVKAPSSSVSDNEVKTKVIQAIDTYFDIRNWDFGEKFFYTELAAFIHQQLSKIISSVVIVPNNANSQFGNLFEIVASPTQIFMSTATVNNVQIVANLTDQNLRV